MVALIDVTVAQGELRTLDRAAAGRLRAAPDHRQLARSSRRRADARLMLTVGNPAARSHQFLISLERPHAGGIVQRSTPASSACSDVQRERGEIAIEGVGTLELTADERDRRASHRRARAESARCSRWRGCRCCRRSAISGRRDSRAAAGVRA